MASEDTSGATRVLFALGILSTIAGLILLAIPGISLLALVVVVSVWLILFGLLEISFGLRLRWLRAA